MAHVSIAINGRNYTVACDDGEEAHLSYLAGIVDQKVSELTRSIGQVPEGRLLLMACLVLADELSERQEQVELLGAELTQVREGGRETGARNAQAEVTVAQVLEAATRRIEDIAARLS